MLRITTTIIAYEFVVILMFFFIYLKYLINQLILVCT